MKITVLGTANAWGPNPFLSPAPTWPMGGKLSDGKTSIQFRKYRTSLLVETADRKCILVDCSPDFGHQLREFRIGRLDAIVITHPHLDHIGGLDELSLYKAPKKKPPKIPTWATEQCWNCITSERGFDYVVDKVELAAANVIREGQAFSVGSVRITAFPVEHSAIAPGSVGFVFEEKEKGKKRSKGLRRALYTGDFWAFSRRNDKVLRQKFDVAILECDRWAGLTDATTGGGHMSFREALRIVKDGALSSPRPRQVVFVHFGDNGPKGTRSSYGDWHKAALEEIDKQGLNEIAPDRDKVIGYEGLVL